jgi:hypothetical protein
MSLTGDQIVRALGEPMTLPNAPGTLTWACPLCAVGPDSLLVTDGSALTCSLAGHGRGEIERAIALLAQTGGET